MLIHGTSPISMVTGTMIPIPKVKHLICTSDNFRAITLSSVLGKLFDLIVLDKEQEALCTSDLQFGFKAGVSTTQCTNVFNETVSHYNFNKSNVFVLFLDATKAFDRVKYCKLFKELIKRNVSPLVLRLLLDMYTRQSLRVKWKNVICDDFNVCNGVKQGGVLSPVLFAVYMDGLIKRLKNSGVGCYMGNHFVGAIAYADDVILVCPTKKSLNILKCICEVYAHEFSITFNVKKSVLLVFKGRECSEPEVCVYVNGDKIEKSVCADHLGHRVSTNDKESMCKAATASFWKYFNMFMCDFGHTYSIVKSKLFKVYCCSFYGAPLWSMNSSSVSDLCVAWHKALRKVWNVPPQTHNRTIALLSDSVPLDISLKARFCKFARKTLHHPNRVISSVMQIAVSNPWSVVGKNYRNLDVFDNISINLWKESIMQNELCETKFLSEMINVRDGHQTCHVYTKDEVNALIEYLCVK